jgi:hypothetical protein
MVEHISVEDADAAARHRSHSQLFVTRHAELTHEEHVQWSAKRPCDLVANRYTATGQSQDQQVRSAHERSELGGELTPGVGSILEVQGTGPRGIGPAVGVP